jgi:hypothetical protein
LPVAATVEPGSRGCCDRHHNGATALTHYNPDIHHRRSIRLRSYDYAQAGAYFITICTQDRACLFGEIVAGTMRPNEPGRMIEHWWDELGAKFQTLTTDAFVLMPNHVHGIIILADVPIAPAANPVGADLRVRPAPSTAVPVLGPGRKAAARADTQVRPYHPSRFGLSGLLLH